MSKGMLGESQVFDDLDNPIRSVEIVWAHQEKLSLRWKKRESK